MAEKKMLHTKAEVLHKEIKESEGVIEAVVGSSNVIDRMGDTIDQSGWDLKYYKKTNPVILWGHNIREERPPIAKALKVWVRDKGEKAAKLMFKIKFDLQDNFAKEIFRKVKDGFVNTVSVGFLPTEWEELEAKDEKKGCFGNYKYLKQELLELSFVSVPANPEAVIELRGMKDKRFTPVELKDLYPQEEEEPFDITKPFPNEHACRLESPGKYKRFRRNNCKGKHDGKCIDFIFGVRDKDGEEVTELQSMRYPKKVWDQADARKHCKDSDGTFEAASDEAGVKEEPKEEKPEEKEPEALEPQTVEPEVETPSGEEVAPKEEPEKEVPDEEGEPEETPDEGEQEPEGDEPVDEPAVEDEPEEQELEAEEPEAEPKEDVPLDEPQAPVAPVETKKVIPYKDLGTVPESAPWDGPGEVKKAETDDLKLMCTWYDDDKPEAKGSYKLPHHKAEGHKCVWRGVAAAMAALLGARGGVNIPDSDRKGVYNHLKKHYKQFDKDIPDFKMVEDQILQTLDEEIHALTLDREDRYMVRLIKKVLQKQKGTAVAVVKSEKVTLPTTKQLEGALKVLDLALSIYQKDSPKGGGTKG